MIGETIGHFKVTSELGRGGMGEVYLAEQTSIGTRVAIKFLQADLADRELVERFFNEARAVSRIQHAGIVRIHDVGTHNDRAYLVMEFLDGESLSQRIARGALGVAQIADLGRQIASVLEATHAAGITHRDLKPDNIYIVPDRELASRERVKVLDFGIAKLTGAVAGPKTVTGNAMGTPDYMAPEQWGDAATVDHRADIYSLGCVAFQMATGRTPFVTTSIADACNKHLNTVPPGVRSIAPALPPPLEALIARMLAKKPELRPQSMADIVRAFEVVGRAAAAPPVRPTPMPTPQHVPVGTPRSYPPMPAPAKSRTGLIVGLSIGVVVVLLAGLAAIGAATAHASCEDAVDHTVDRVGRAMGMPPDGVQQMRANMINECRSTNWSDELRDCMAHADDPSTCNMR